MNFSFHPEAEREFNQAIDYYEDLQENLGLEFALPVTEHRVCSCEAVVREQRCTLVK